MSVSFSTLLLPRAMGGSRSFWLGLSARQSHSRLVRARKVSQEIGAQPGEERPRCQETNGRSRVRRGSPSSLPFPARQPAARAKETSAAYSLSLHSVFSRLLARALSAHTGPAPGTLRPHACVAARTFGPASFREPARAAGQGRPLLSVGWAVQALRAQPAQPGGAAGFCARVCAGVRRHQGTR